MCLLRAFHSHHLIFLYRFFFCFFFNCEAADTWTAELYCCSYCAETHILSLLSLSTVTRCRVTGPHLLPRCRQGQRSHFLYPVSARSPEGLPVRVRDLQCSSSAFLFVAGALGEPQSLSTNFIIPSLTAFNLSNLSYLCTLCLCLSSFISLSLSSPCYFLVPPSHFLCVH